MKYNEITLHFIMKYNAITKNYIFALLNYCSIEIFNNLYANNLSAIEIY